MNPLPAVAIATSTAAASVLGQLGGNTSITLGEAATVFVFTASLIAWLSRKLQKIEDDIDRIKTELAARPCQRDEKCPR